MSEKEVTEYTKNGNCVIIECQVKNGNELVELNYHTDLIVALDGHIERNELPKEYKAFFLCKEENANNLAKEITDYYSKK